MEGGYFIDEADMMLATCNSLASSGKTEDARRSASTDALRKRLVLNVYHVYFPFVFIY